MIRIMVVLILLCCATPVRAEPSYTDFAAWPVLHEGRVKTMESFARSTLYKIARDTHINDMDASTWMAHALFDPSAAVAMPVIFVRDRSGLELPQDRQGHHYSMSEIMVALRPYQDVLMALEQRDPAKLSADQKNLLAVYQAVIIYNQLIQAMSAVLPLQGYDKNYLEGGGSKAQRALIAEGGQDNAYVKIIPHDNPSMPKISLWQAVALNVNSPLIRDLTIMAKAWNDGDDQAWNDKAAQVKDILYAQQSEGDETRLSLEHIYTSVQPILWVMGLYIIGAVMCIRFPMVGVAMIGTGFMLHVSTLVIRFLILMRPPTGTLYETLLFSAAIVMLVGIIAFIKNRNGLFAAGSSVCATLLLFISRGFIEGDSLNVLVAVLNTNFWLSTHVTMIVAGYAMCVVAALSAHLYLFTNRLQIEKMMVPLALVALLFTAIGTLLGGIWADQSWGRFWGWDPKENGALLIVLWLTWILHGCVSGHMRTRGFAAALALTNITVAVTWFGVNLLGVGLHSYGFFSGIAWGLGSFCAIQIIVVAFLTLRHKGRFS